MKIVSLQLGFIVCRVFSWFCLFVAPYALKSQISDTFCPCLQSRLLPWPVFLYGLPRGVKAGGLGLSHQKWLCCALLCTPRGAWSGNITKRNDSCRQRLWLKPISENTVWEGCWISQVGDGWDLFPIFLGRLSLGLPLLPVLTWGISSPLWEKKQNWKWWQEVFAGELLPHCSIPDKKGIQCSAKGKGLSRKEKWSRKPSVKLVALYMIFHGSELVFGNGGAEAAGRGTPGHLQLHQQSCTMWWGTGRRVAPDTGTRWMHREHQAVFCFKGVLL